MICYYICCDQTTKQQTANPKGVTNMATKQVKKQAKISAIEITNA